MGRLRRRRGVGTARRRGTRCRAADLRIDSDVPIGAGLSSSAALECAVAVALDELGGLGLGRTELALLAQRAENDYVGVPCGVMDQMAAMHGRAGHLVYLDCRTLAVELVPFDLAAAGLALLVVDTKAPHRLVDGEYADRRRTCEQAADALGVRALRDVPLDGLDAALAALPDQTTRRRVRHVVTENARVLDTVALLRDGKLADIGPLLTASHASMRDDYQITVPEIDVAVEAALAAGALGATDDRRRVRRLRHRAGRGRQRWMRSLTGYGPRMQGTGSPSRSRSWPKRPTERDGRSDGMSPTGEQYDIVAGRLCSHHHGGRRDAAHPRVRGETARRGFRRGRDPAGVPRRALGAVAQPGR